MIKLTHTKNCDVQKSWRTAIWRGLFQKSSLLIVHCRTFLLWVCFCNIRVSCSNWYDFQKDLKPVSCNRAWRTQFVTYILICTVMSSKWQSYIHIIEIRFYGYTIWTRMIIILLQNGTISSGFLTKIAQNVTYKKRDVLSNNSKRLPDCKLFTAAA